MHSRSSGNRAAFGLIIPLTASCLDKASEIFPKLRVAKSDLRLFGATQVVEDDHS
jgi:hypothetical protein